MQCRSALRLWSRVSSASASRFSSTFKAKNEPLLQYQPGSKERRDLDAALSKYSSVCTEIPVVIGDQEYLTQDVVFQVEPFNHQKRIAKVHRASPDLIKKAIEVSVNAQKQWDRVPLAEKAKIFLRAADMIAGPRRMDLMATTMLGQAKTWFQAEIDAAAELIDFLRFNVQFAMELEKYKPLDSSESTNALSYRGLEGFVAAISPFNFTAIGGNLATAPALMGCSVLWKPSDTAVLSNYTAFQVLREAGLPAGVINFVPADGPTFGQTVTSSPHLAAVNFTGSVATFRRIWKMVADNLDTFKSYPRLVGECGGKNFHLIHGSADVDSAIAATARSAFEYSGQKCSACSRVYVPASLWPRMKEGLIEKRKKLKIGSPVDSDTFTSAVIDGVAFRRIGGFLRHAHTNLKVLAGGQQDDSVGYFVQPTLVETSNPKDRIMVEEVFGPVVAIFVFPDKEYRKVLQLVDETSPFGLTGALFAQDESVIRESYDVLRHAAGNLYINDKSTGAVVGQQPFGGARLSGTNDKAGGPHYLLKWTSPQAVKRTFVKVSLDV